MNDQDFLAMDDEGQDEILSAIQAKLGVNEPSENILQKTAKIAMRLGSTDPMNQTIGGMLPGQGIAGNMASMADEYFTDQNVKNFGGDTKNPFQRFVASPNNQLGLIMGGKAIGEGVGNVAKNAWVSGFKSA